MNLRILIPRFAFGRLDGNHHIYRKGKYGPKFGVRRKGYSFVQLGKGYARRHTYGLRFWYYYPNGSCWHVDVYFWDGKQHEVNYDNAAKKTVHQSTVA